MCKTFTYSYYGQFFVHKIFLSTSALMFFVFPFVVDFVNCPFVRLFICSFVRLFVCPFVRLFVFSFVRLFVCPFVRLWLILSTVLSYVRSFVCSSFTSLVQLHLSLSSISFVRIGRFIYKKYILSWENIANLFDDARCGFSPRNQLCNYFLIIASSVTTRNWKLENW